jgi:opacity protein-like surface antigen
MRARGTARTDVSAVETTSTSAAAATGIFDAAMTVMTIAPQLSFNFGTHEGWSYLSGGYGISTTHTEVNTPDSFGGEGGSSDRRTSALNFGGGARWFLREHLAVGFDVRFHRLLARNPVPTTQMVGLSVGVSLR